MRPGDLQAALRRKLQWKPGSAALLWRLGHHIIDSATGRLSFTVADSTAVLWFADHQKTVDDLTRRVDFVAEKYEVDVSAVAPDGTVLYRRMMTS